MAGTIDSTCERVAVAADPEGPGGRLLGLAEDGAALGDPVAVPDLGPAMAELEAARRPRWVWAATDSLYPVLLRRPGLRLSRCHDIKLVETLLCGHEGEYGQPRSLGAAWARLHGLAVPDDLPETAAAGQPVLFEADRHQLPPGTDPLAAVAAVHAEQLRRTARTEHPDRMRLLCAAESAGALAAAEMSHDGLPWSADAHNTLLTELLGPRPIGGAQPALLGELATRIQRSLGCRPFNPDSHPQVLRAFAEAGIILPSTRSHVLKGVNHPAADLMLRYKELSRIHAAHGWAWQETWARGGRFRPEYVVGGVVSGRWATRGGGALQIPRPLRAAAVADPGWRLVVADAGQLEPRVLAAMSGDPGLARAAAAGDLYAGLAQAAFDGDRDRAKIGLLAAMYGQTSGEAGALVAVLRRRFPAAMELVESAARTGEGGGLVRSHLGRTSPRLEERPGEESAARARGRFTRNFVIQATAAEWALAVLAVLRRHLTALGPPRLVFFQHDEVVVHTPSELAPDVTRAVDAAAAEATRLLFGPTPVPFPLQSHVVGSYAEAK
ncbi:bifunctional 3'-5' exonuclease/DNA polymerase [Wenjunlia tyrosinilytica]|uniref:bifunctional 3'-5' exonuclease/DNA polymerase n=1 Tax=Wenjunlia tyrosinilytica TaxID=1544741 RepID=UPI001E4D2254|nr:bifunctional 3'-5' exonuclease/DNA polymerase [Wenjunlia tyrosinilytica]